MGRGDGSGEGGGMGVGSGKGKSDIEDACACCAAFGACAICCVVVLLVIGLGGLSIAKIVMGAIYLHDCDIQYLIPIYLIVSGCASILFGGMGRQQSDENDQKISCAAVCGSIALLFNLAWTICGSVWTYGTWATIKGDDYVPCGGNVTVGCEKTCDDVLLTFSFAVVTIDWALLGLLIVLFCCTTVVALLCK